MELFHAHNEDKGCGEDGFLEHPRPAKLRTALAGCRTYFCIALQCLPKVDRTLATRCCGSILRLARHLDHLSPPCDCRVYGTRTADVQVCRLGFETAPTPSHGIHWDRNIFVSYRSISNIHPTAFASSELFRALATACKHPCSWDLARPAVFQPSCIYCPSSKLAGFSPQGRPG